MATPEYMKKWRAENKAKIAAYNKEWRKAHPGYFKQKAAEYRIAKPEKSREYDRRKYSKHKVAMLARAAARYRKDIVMSREKSRQYGRVWMQKQTPGRKRDIGLRYNYGISLEDLERMRVAQKGRCAICTKDLKNREHVDHDHATGDVRGLLCARCNQGIGFLRDDPHLLMAAASYILRHVATQRKAV